MTTFKIAFKAFIFIAILTGMIYPLIVTVIAQITMPDLANGSLVNKEEKVIGSALIAQNAQADHYFWPRPSAIDYDPLRPSGGSNLGPTSQKLKEEVDKRKQKYGDSAPPDLLYASGSGLDPHMSFETAMHQVQRVAQARSLDEEELKTIIESMREKKQLGLLGSGYINVLLLNHALDEKHPINGIIE